MSILSRKFGRMAPRPFDPAHYLTLNRLGVVATSVSRYDTLPLTTDVMGDKTQLIDRTSHFREQFGEDGNMVSVGMQDSAVYQLRNFQQFEELSRKLRTIKA